MFLRNLQGIIKNVSEKFEQIYENIKNFKKLSEKSEEILKTQANLQNSIEILEKLQV